MKENDKNRSSHYNPRRWNPRKWLKTEIKNFVSQEDFRMKYIVDPKRHFLRQRKLKIWEIIYIFFLLPGHMPSEVISDFYRDRSIEDEDYVAPCRQAYMKALKKLKFGQLIEDLTHKMKADLEAIAGEPEDVDAIFRDVFHEYTIYSVDGTDINLPYDRDDEEYFIKENKLGYRGHNSVHMNCIIRNEDGTMMSIKSQGAHKKNEKDAARIQIIEEGIDWGENPLFIFDRGYYSTQLVRTLIRNNYSFLMRIQDVSSSKALSKTLIKHIPDNELHDEGAWRIRHYFAPSMTKKMKEMGASLCLAYPYEDDVDVKHIANERGGSCAYIECDLTLIRLRLDDPEDKTTEPEYECLLTNLAPGMFTLEEWKCLYHLRWKIETSIRSWKYYAGADRVSFRNRDLNLTGLKASEILYNMTKIATRKTRPTDLPKRQKSKEGIHRKHLYRISEAAAARKLYAFLRDDRGAPSYLYKEIGRMTECLRPNRHCSRNLKPKGFNGFTYRVA